MVSAEGWPMPDCELLAAMADCPATLLELQEL
jgi:hypothetical protein